MSEPYLRKATVDDMELLFEWANDKETRQNAFNSHQITYEEHQKWFLRKLESGNTAIYIYCIEDIPIGQVRIDIDNENGLISYSVDAEHRSRGHGSKTVELLETIVSKETLNLKVLIAKVKKSNIPSQRVFERLHYLISEKDDYIEYKKEI